MRGTRDDVAIHTGGSSGAVLGPLSTKQWGEKLEMWNAVLEGGEMTWTVRHSERWGLQKRWCSGSPAGEDPGKKQKVQRTVSGCLLWTVRHPFEIFSNDGSLLL